MKKRVRLVLICVFAAAAIFSGVMALFQLLEYHKGETTYAGLDQYIRIEPNRQPSDSPAETGVETPPESDSSDRTLPEKLPPERPGEEETLPISVDFAALQVINPDLVGWIYSETLDISYPVVQTTDNSYYLNHMFDGNVNSSGCLFLDCNNSGDFSDFNSIIYGHNMKNGAMFEPLLAYADQSCFDANPVMYFLTPERAYQIQLFACYTADVWDEAWQITFATDVEKISWLSNRFAESEVVSQASPDETDHILTLSTCSYRYNDARFVVFGILQEYGSSESAASGQSAENGGAETPELKSRQKQ